MPERLEKLKEIVRELEAELAALETIDPQAQKVLEDAVSELHAALGRNAATIEAKSLAERLQRAESEFQVSHPTLSGIVMRMVDALGQLGI